MNKLIEIAKANGALPVPVSRNEQQYIFTEQQLRATVEQVCAPLVKFAQKETYLNTLMGIDECRAAEAYTAFLVLIGDKHE